MSALGQGLLWLRFSNRSRALGKCKLARCSEEHEDLLDVALDVLDLLADDVEADGLGEGTALADSHDIAGAEAEGRGAVSSHGLVALLEPVVLLDVVEVVAADDDGVLHLGGNDDTPTRVSH